MRKVIQDIIIRKKYSVKDGSVSLKKAEIYNEKTKVSKPIRDTELYDETMLFSKPQKTSSLFIWCVSVISVIALFFVFSYVFSSAEIIITPKTEKVSLDNSWNISTDKNFEGLHYQIISQKLDLSKNLATDGDEYIERKATGKAIMYNNYSSQSQRLISNTRLEAANGLIYRVRDSVEIPGTKIIKGVKTPGSAEIEIIADTAGDKYNMALDDFKGDFKVPGFKASPKYIAFYGRLSEDMKGGFVGNIKKVSGDKVIAGRDELKGSLNDALLKNMYASVSEKTTIFKDNYYVQYNDMPDQYVGNDLKVTEEGTISAIAFDTDELASFIAKQKIKNFDGGKVALMLSNLTATTSGATERPWLENSLKFSISGDTSVVWKYDKNAILLKIVGQNKSIVYSIAKENKASITSIVANIRPMWFGTFPNQTKKIKVIDTVAQTVK